ncbi:MULTISPECIES: ribosomal protein S18-alanine N-acetyltransferase [Clostridium]|uniref:[Ribosomal protein bS18]-alanine N-acetyltransferase n=1 Tax=Clostridium cibarium TaxID=2762247 RepID=A0ABR8PXR5_9CLOT|nr:MULTISPECIES: ribosomal protein S18-alanine N-acetyltransferase [Clostridium]MBD7912973.1 ribosomal protein S18-alanine N-acetyltransferase [Clostridium cibarium]
MSVKLSLMKKEDLSQVLEISSLSLKESWSLDSFSKELSNPLAKYVVAKTDNKTVGFAGVWIIVDEGHITNIAVHPEFREKGIGSDLVQSLIEHSKSWGCHSLTLEVRASNKPAQNLYKKFGFVEEGIRKRYYQDNKEDAIIMWKR